jgi:hypothetical protein
LRKPPSAADSNTPASGEVAPGAPADAIAPEAATATTSLTQTAQAVEMTTRLGERREVTLLLPVDVARKLAVRCLEIDRDTSSFVAEILTKALETEPVATRDTVTITVSGSAWARVRARIAELTSWLPWNPLVPPQQA